MGTHRKIQEVRMSIVIIGGHDRMVCQYKKVCQKYQCKAKVFTQMSGNLSKKIGTPDLVVLFTNTVSHKMVRCAVEEAGRCNAEIIRCHTICKNDQLQKSKIEEKYRKMYKKESIRYEICMVYSLLI